MASVVALISALVGLLSGLTAGLARENVSAITGLPADRIAFAAPAAGHDLSYADSTVTERQWRQWAQAPGVRRAEPLGVTTTRATAGGRAVTVSAFGVPPGSTLAPAAVDEGTLVLSRPAADELRVRAGESVTVAGRALRVAAVTGDASYSHLPVVWTALDTWPAVGPRTATVIALTTTSAVDVGAVDAAAGTRTVATGDSLSAIGSYRSENGSLQLMRGFLFAIAALVVGAFFSVWTIQRGADIAVLKALGASTGYLLRDALGQAVALLVAGTATGAAVAAGLGALVSSAVPFQLTATTVLVPAAVTIVLGAVGAALSVRRITSVDPLTALGSAR
ncbi:FtsX-like permease family protein [Micromonospora sp. NPDC050686]|uniref:ABC transporter permease n=1 Tax=Micromonospora sp. NPDC050686 TaxID=3154631 RepID=UPI003408083D